MPQPVLEGARATAGTQGVLANVRVIDMSDTIHLLDPNEAPLTAITMKLSKVAAVSPKVEWLEDDYLPTTDVTVGTAAAAATNITVTNGEYFRVGDLLKVLVTGETLYVSAISGDDMTTSSVTDTATDIGTQIPEGSTVLIIGNANAENSARRTIKTTKKTAQSNVTQIFRWEFGASGTLQASELYGGDDLSYQQRKAGKEHRIQIERSFLFGELWNDETGATPIRFCQGILDKISTNSLDANGTLTSAGLETFLREGMRYGPARKMLFASRTIVSALSTIARNSIRTFPTDSSFPLALTEYISPHGKLYIVTHNLLADVDAVTPATLGYPYEGWGILLDLDSVFYRPLRGRDTRLKTNIQANDADGRIDGYITECCPMLIQEQNHSYMFDVLTGGT
jgi:hypothetical protein